MPIDNMDAIVDSLPSMREVRPAVTLSDRDDAFLGATRDDRRDMMGVKMMLLGVGWGRISLAIGTDKVVEIWDNRLVRKRSSRPSI
jgi:hypothetical protein